MHQRRGEPEYPRWSQSVGIADVAAALGTSLASGVACLSATIVPDNRWALPPSMAIGHDCSRQSLGTSAIHGDRPRLLPTIVGHFRHPCRSETVEYCLSLCFAIEAQCPLIVDDFILTKVLTNAKHSATLWCCIDAGTTKIARHRDWIHTFVIRRVPPATRISMGVFSPHQKARALTAARSAARIRPRNATVRSL